MPRHVIDGRSIDVHRLGRREATPQMVFLHEGLGSIELWRSYPEDVVTRTGGDGVVYSRYGHGWSDPLAEPRTPAFMHHEGLTVLPQIRRELSLERPVLIGHSDGASIAIIHAGAGHDVAALVLLAPHVFVEVGSMAGLDAAWERFHTTDLVERMAKYHADPEATFRGWAEIWTSPEFLTWNIEEYLGGITCPVLLIQGEDDEYGTKRQLDAVAGQVGGPVESVLLADCGHSPHLSRPAEVVDLTVSFVTGIST